MKLKVLENPLEKIFLENKKKFIEAYATKTRLQGAIGIYVKWEIEEPKKRIVYQFFNITTNANIIENYESIKTQDKVLTSQLMSHFIYCIGNDLCELNEREFYHIIKKGIENIEEAPSDIYKKLKKETIFISKKRTRLSEEEQKELARKLIDKLSETYQVINSFITRYTETDFEALKYLCSKEIKENLFSDKLPGLVLKNDIKQIEENEFRCKFVVEGVEEYSILVGVIKINGLEVEDFQEISSMKISPSEIAIISNRCEYISYYLGITSTDPGFIEGVIDSMFFATTSRKYDNGTLIMIYTSNNDYLNTEKYSISDDVLGAVFISDISEVIIASSNIKNITNIKNKILSSILNSKLSLINNFNFAAPVLYDYIDSNFENFISFLEDLK